MLVQTEKTPNPNSLKFLPGEIVSNSGSYEITKKEDINNWNPVDYEILAQGENLDIYNRGYNNFRKLYNNTKDLMKEMDD